MFYFLIGIFGAVTTFIYIRNPWLFGEKHQALRVLMYHKFSDNQTDFLTVRLSDFDRQLAYLVSKGYIFVSMQDVVEAYFENKKLPPNPVLITMDDAYLSQTRDALPILQKHQARATIFVPTAFIGAASAWDSAASPIASVEELKNLPPSVFELAPHTHRHENYKNLSLEAITADINSCLAFFHTHRLPYVPAFAFAFGARLKNAEILRGMQNHFQQHKIRLAFRIGNRINSLKNNDLYEMQRIDVRGDEAFETFVKKVKWGRLI